MSGRDLLTGNRNAFERLGADIARQIVDDARNLDFGGGAKGEAVK